MGTAPQMFAGIASEARAQLAAANALVRRYLHVLAAELTLPPRAVGVPSENSNQPPASLQRSREPLFRLSEAARPSSYSARSQAHDPPELQWALMSEAVRRLPPWTDALICRLDQAARPEDWEGMDTS